MIGSAKRENAYVTPITSCYHLQKGVIQNKNQKKKGVDIPENRVTNGKGSINIPPGHPFISRITHSLHDRLVIRIPARISGMLLLLHHSILHAPRAAAHGVTHRTRDTATAYRATRWYNERWQLRLSWRVLWWRWWGSRRLDLGIAG